MSADSAVDVDPTDLERRTRAARERVSARVRERISEDVEAVREELERNSRPHAEPEAPPTDEEPPPPHSVEEEARALARSSRGNGSPPPHGDNRDASAPTVEPFELASAATWAGKPPPPPREWVLEGMVPAGRVTSFLGNGGLGKSIIAGQIGVHVAIGNPIFGLTVKSGPVIGLFCEDEADELERRVRAAAAGEHTDLARLAQFYPSSRDGEDTVLCTFDHDLIVLTSVYHRLEATVAKMRPILTIVDTAADVFAGDYLSTPHVRQFIKIALGRLCVRYGTAVLLIAHPSGAAMASGDGGGFSTAWNNSVRSRLFLRRPKSDDLEAIADRRILEVRKANYAADGLRIPVVYQNGYFVPDPEPLEEAAATKVIRPAKLDTKLAVGVMEYMRAQSGSGTVVIKFAALYEHLQGTGALPRGAFETVRKQLQRTLSSLEKSDLIQKTKVPLGCYRLVVEAP